MTRYDVIARPDDQPQRDILGEGPFWCVHEQALYWADIAGRRAHRYDPSTGAVRTWATPSTVSTLIPATSGGAVVALADGLYRFDFDKGVTTAIAKPDADPLNRSNETRCDPQGRVWLGTMHNNIGEGGEPQPISRASGGFWCIEADGRSTKILGDIGITNTLCWSPDQSRFYCADTMKGVIWSFAYDPDGPTLSDQQVFVAEGPGGPDGSSMDAEGCLWNARWGANRLIRYRPDGRIDREIELPVEQPTSCVFGGPDLKTLYITSAKIELENPNELDGALLAIQVDVAGLPMTPFAG